jgi:hypothetical protein
MLLCAKSGSQTLTAKPSNWDRIIGSHKRYKAHVKEHHNSYRTANLIMSSVQSNNLTTKPASLDSLIAEIRTKLTNKKTIETDEYTISQLANNFLSNSYSAKDLATSYKVSTNLKLKDDLHIIANKLVAQHNEELEQQKMLFLKAIRRKRAREVHKLRDANTTGEKYSASLQRIDLNFVKRKRAILGSIESSQAFMDDENKPVMPEQKKLGKNLKLIIKQFSKK